MALCLLLCSLFLYLGQRGGDAVLPLPAYLLQPAQPAVFSSYLAPAIYIKFDIIVIDFDANSYFYLGTLDLTIHGTDVPQTEEALQALVDKLNLEISLIANPSGCNMLRNFGQQQ